MWDNSHMDQGTVAKEVTRRMKALGLNAKSLSKRAGLNETFVRDLSQGKSRNPRADSLDKLATALGCTVSDLTGGNGSALLLGKAVAQGQSWEPATVDELDVRAAAGAGQLIESETKIGEWQLPRELVKLATNSPLERIKILTIIGDSMIPTYSPLEKVMVDTGDTRPAPPGVFVLWEGLGFVVKRVEHIPHSEPPRIKISSDNPKYSTYERVLEEAYIQGRVIGKWLWT